MFVPEKTHDKTFSFNQNRHSLVDTEGIKTQFEEQRVPQRNQKKMDSMASFPNQSVENAVVTSLNYLFVPQSQMAVTKMDRRTTEKA